MTLRANIQELLYSERYQECIEACQNILKENHEEISAWKYAGKSLLALGHIQKAQQCLAKAHELNQSDPEIANEIGNTFLKLGGNDSALEWYEKAIEIKSDYAPALSNIANLKRQSGKLQEAIALFQKAIQADPKLVQAYVGSAAIYLTVGELDQSESLANQALELNKDTPFANEILGIVLQKKNNPEQAIEYHHKELNNNPASATSLLNLGLIFLLQGNADTAIESLKKASAIKPSEECSLLLAQAYLKLGRLEEAEMACKNLNQNSSVYYYIYGMILVEMQDLIQAESYFKKSIEMQKGFVQGHKALSELYQKLGRLSESHDSNKCMIIVEELKAETTELEFIGDNTPHEKPSAIEHPNLYSPGMGTENIGGFLRSMTMMLRPKRVLEIGAGYTTPFLLEGIVNNKRVFDDGSLKESYFENYTYDAKLLVIDNQSQEELASTLGMQAIIDSKYTEFIEGDFQGKANELYQRYGCFDFVWFDCGGPDEYLSFLREYWDYCSGYMFFHFTYYDGSPNQNHTIIRENIKGNYSIFDIVEPHKKRQGSITMVNKTPYTENDSRVAD